ncbi:5-oxoprolinase [Forsythia ovata]|uniref:5-oxoprolinase n=1 Tax=Forsythia ovata TaxID=205694 RepID=A0ABD1T3S0_9LAMI
MNHVQVNAEEAVREMLKSVVARISSNSAKGGEGDLVIIEEEDFMDDGKEKHLLIFLGLAPKYMGIGMRQRQVTSAAVIYCLRCLVDVDIPLNQGCLAPVKIFIPPGSFLSPSDRAAVVGGNVLTSQRITDVILIAFQACACSQGCMNNLTFGDNTFGYYETIGGWKWRWP